MQWSISEIKVVQQTQCIYELSLRKNIKHNEMATSDSGINRVTHLDDTVKEMLWITVWITSFLVEHTAVLEPGMQHQNRYSACCLCWQSRSSPFLFRPKYWGWNAESPPSAMKPVPVSSPSKHLPPLAVPGVLSTSTTLSRGDKASYAWEKTDQKEDFEKLLKNASTTLNYTVRNLNCAIHVCLSSAFFW